jgi:putative ABC transport system permease protein
MSVVFSFRIIGFPDLTPDGSFALGAGVAAALLLRGNGEALATIAAVVAGAVTGTMTAYLHTELRISKLLSGILMMTLLYSVALRVMGTSNLSLLRSRTVVSALGDAGNMWFTCFVAVLASAVCFVLWALLQTELGLRLRSAGETNQMLEYRGLSRRPFYVVGLALSNAVAAFSGAIMAEYQGFADVSMGLGLVIICLAAVIVGETVIRPGRVSSLLFAPILGMVLYQCIIAGALRIGLKATDLKLVSAVLVLAFVGIERLRRESGSTGRQIGNRSI